MEQRCHPHRCRPDQRERCACRTSSRGYARLALDTGYTLVLGGDREWQFTASVDNLADRRYIGSVIVNNGNGTYYEPDSGHSYTLGARFTF